MAKLPTYDSRQGISTASPIAKRDPSEEAQLGRDIQTIGKAASGIAQVWQDAEDFSQTLTNKNNLAADLGDIQARAKADPDYNNSKAYYDEIQAAKEKSMEGFTNNLARQQFSLTANNEAAQSQIKVQGMFRDKMIKFTQGELIRSREEHKDKYLLDGNPKHISDYLNIDVAAAYGKGLVDPVFVANQEIETGKWEAMRYFKVAESDPAGAIKLVKESDMQPSEKKAALSNIASMAKQQDIVAELNDLARQQEMVRESRAVIASPDAGYVEKLNFIQQKEKFGMQKVDADRLTAYLNSTDKINASSYDDAKVGMLLRIGTLDGGVDKKTNVKDIKDYLLSVKSTEDYLIEQRTAGRLTQADEEQLQDELDKVVAEEKALAGGKIKNVKDAVWFQDYWIYGYDDAYKDFMTNFNQNDLNANAALVEYFSRISGKKYNNEEKKAEMNKVVTEMKQDFRKKTVEAMTGVKIKEIPVRQETETEIFDRLKGKGFKTFDEFNSLVEQTMKNKDMTRTQVIEFMRGVK